MQGAAEGADTPTGAATVWKSCGNSQCQRNPDYFSSQINLTKHLLVD